MLSLLPWQCSNSGGSGESIYKIRTDSRMLLALRKEDHGCYELRTHDIAVMCSMQPFENIGAGKLKPSGRTANPIDRLINSDRSKIRSWVGFVTLP